MSAALIETLPKSHDDSVHFKSILIFEQILFVLLSRPSHRMRLDGSFLLVPNHLQLFAKFDGAAK
jgi:hypothetical protein